MTTGNETNAGQTWGAPIHIWVFSYLPCDRRDRVLFRTARRNYYPAAWEFATAREPKHLNLPFRKFLRLSKPRSWTGDPEHVKYRSISLGPLAHAGIYALVFFYFTDMPKTYSNFSCAFWVFYSIGMHFATGDELFNASVIYRADLVSRLGIHLVPLFSV